MRQLWRHVFYARRIDYRIDTRQQLIHHGFCFFNLALELSNRCPVFRQNLWLIQFFRESLKDVAISFFYLMETTRHLFCHSAHVSITDVSTNLIHTDGAKFAQNLILHLSTNKLFQTRITKNFIETNNVSLFEEFLELFFEVLRGFLILRRQRIEIFFLVELLLESLLCSRRSFHTTTCLL